MKPKMKLTVLKCSKCFFTDDLLELIVRETNTYAEQKKKKIRNGSNIPF
jgi:hypothetical protein